MVPRWTNMCRRRRLATSLLLLLIASVFLIFTLYLKTSNQLLGNGHLPQDHLLAESKKGIPVIVGHYMGNDNIGNTKLTKELLDTNGYDPVVGAGENGEAFEVGAMDVSRMHLLFHINKFNLMASDRISANRSLPDVRHKNCQQHPYKIVDQTHLDTSIIIVFHNEAWSTLIRTIRSVINRSPNHLLHEIILVDDASERKFLKDELDLYVAKLEVLTKIIRLKERVGLIQARLKGADVAEGQVLTFLDAHCECTIGWLEPLLETIHLDRKTVAVPVIDIISDDTFAYVRSFDLHWGAFNWELHFRWLSISPQIMQMRRKDITQAFKTPVMAGGLFAIEKKYFQEIGTYDEQMDIWGGENIEISFRVWQCGGSIQVVPCSHVGHVFRKASPYNFPRPGGIGSVLYKNLARVAEVWMDEWKEFYFKLNPAAQAVRHKIDVEDRLELRKQMNCKSFRWYLENVWPEHFLPTEDAFFGMIRNKKYGQCLRKPKSQTGGNQATGNALIAECTHPTFASFEKQLYVLTSKGYLMSDESVCLDAPDPNVDDPPVYFLACTFQTRQRWKYDYSMETIVHLDSGLCLLASSKSSTDGLSLGPCSMSENMQWKLQPFIWR